MLTLVYCLTHHGDTDEFYHLYQRKEHEPYRTWIVSREEEFLFMARGGQYGTLSTDLNFAHLITLAWHQPKVLVDADAFFSLQEMSKSLQTLELGGDIICDKETVQEHCANKMLWLRSLHTVVFYKTDNKISFPAMRFFEHLMTPNLSRIIAFDSPLHILPNRIREGIQILHEHNSYSLNVYLTLTEVRRLVNRFPRLQILHLSTTGLAHKKIIQSQPEKREFPLLRYVSLNERPFVDRYDYPKLYLLFYIICHQTGCQPAPMHLLPDILRAAFQTHEFSWPRQWPSNLAHKKYVKSRV